MPGPDADDDDGEEEEEIEGDALETMDEEEEEDGGSRTGQSSRVFNARELRRGGIFARGP